MENENHDIFRIGNDIYFTGEVNRLNINIAIKELNILYQEHKQGRFWINSYGGEAIEARRFFDYLNLPFNPNLEMIGIINGSCQSAALIMLMAFKERLMTKHSICLLHDVCNALEAGDYDTEELTRISSGLEIYNEQAIEIIHTKTGLSPDIIKKIMKDGKCFNSQKALELGLVTKII